eukprot:PhM_4_TR8294/c0_g1_i1/m.42139/K08825/DYRK1; dual specificity tyrosine-phosphorylation-regulated kinase 1
MSTTVSSIPAAQRTAPPTSAAMGPSVANSLASSTNAVVGTPGAGLSATQPHNNSNNTSAASSSMHQQQPQPRAHRPIVALGPDLLATYKVINEKFYANKRKNKAMGDDPGKPRAVHNDGFDDEHGNYVVQIGEEIAQRYIVREVLGKGSFGVVVKAYDQRRDEQVAVKVIRNRPQFFTQARVEIDILTRLNEAAGGEPALPHTIVKLRKYFTWKDHLCLVFELLSFNLYDLIKFTKFQGVSLNLIRKFTAQLLRTLDFLRVGIPQRPVIHCDLKPENILLVNSKRSAIKVIDFGSSCFETKKMFKYIQSRFYRSPEVILTLNYGVAIDMWSLGCILYELHTGVPIFDGKSELDQLVKMQALLGPLPVEMVESSPKRDALFENKAGTYTLRPPQNGSMPPSRTLNSALSNIIARRSGQAGHGAQDYVDYVSLIQAMLQYQPSQRITPHAAMEHPFVRNVATTATNSADGGQGA